MSVYEQIGGNAAVDAAVDMDRQAAKQKAFLTMAFGGPNKYTGKDMREAHKHMKLADEHFNAVAGHLQGTLEELKVPANLIAEVMKIAASTHDDVLNL